MGYIQDTIKGISWLGMLRASTRLIAIFRIVILARILAPAQFGTFGIAALVLGFVEIITETGINVFLIQERGRIENYLSTAWIVSIGRGIIIALIIVSTAPFVASFFHAPDALPLLLLISLVPLIRGFINPAIVQFQKELQFSREFWLRLAIFVADSLVAVILALVTRSAVSLIWGFIFGAFVEMLLSFMVVRPRPRLSFQVEKVKEVIHRGKWLTAAGFLDYLFRHGDDMVVGRIQPIASLGLYQNAYKISELPITEVADVVSKVTFPVFSKISEDLVRLKRAFLRTLIGTIILVIPIGIVLFLFPRQVITLVLGPQWLDASVALSILALSGVMRAISGCFFAVFLALKKQEVITTALFVNTLILGILIIPLVSGFGIEGAAIAALVASSCGFIVILYYGVKIISSNG